jgi:hypothetical protein
MTDEKQITLEAETGAVVHPPREYVTIVLTASLIVGAICLAILLAFVVFFAPAAAHGVERLKQKISVREQWLATCSHSPRREECYLYATGFYARPLHLARTCTANSAGLLATNLGQ